MSDIREGWYWYRARSWTGDWHPWERVHVGPDGVVSGDSGWDSIEQAESHGEFGDRIEEPPP